MTCLGSQDQVGSGIGGKAFRKSQLPSVLVGGLERPSWDPGEDVRQLGASSVQVAAKGWVLTPAPAGFAQTHCAGKENCRFCLHRGQRQLPQAVAGVFLVPPIQK